MRLHIYSLQNTIHEGETTSVTLPAESGEINVLPNHISLVTTLKKGVVISRNTAETKKFEIEGGMAYTDGTQLIVLAD